MQMALIKTFFLNCMVTTSWRIMTCSLVWLTHMHLLVSRAIRSNLWLICRASFQHPLAPAHVYSRLRRVNTQITSFKLNGAANFTAFVTYTVWSGLWWRLTNKRRFMHCFVNNPQCTLHVYELVCYMMVL